MLNPFEHRLWPYLNRLSHWLLPGWLTSPTNPLRLVHGLTGHRRNVRRRLPNPEERTRRRTLAKEQLSSLENLPDHTSRLQCIRQDRAFQTWDLGFLLLEFSRWLGGSAGFDLADLTLALADTLLAKTPGDRLARDLRAGALLNQARRRETRDNIERSWLALAQSRAEAEQGTGNALLWAELSLEKGALLRARGKWHQATLELAEAVRLLDHLGSTGQAAYGRGELALAEAELLAATTGRPCLSSNPPQGLPSHLWQALAGMMRAGETERAARCLARFRPVLEGLDQEDTEIFPREADRRPTGAFPRLTFRAAPPWTTAGYFRSRSRRRRSADRSSSS
ncbi:MAG: hypothetical protein K0U98_11985 [Deltaproteobacteria bacterium]|nr:hypothetical protein [Deltaproteobacteria bacterium]